MKHLHDNNLVHVDIKPDNIFISHDGVCKLGDFGLVIDLSKGNDFSEAQEGDPKYLAPELMDGKFGKPADIFRLPYLHDCINNISVFTFELLIN